MLFEFVRREVAQHVNLIEQRARVLFLGVTNLFFVTVFFSNSMASSSKATLILLIYGILMHYSVFCTPIGLSYPKIR